MNYKLNNQIQLATKKWINLNDWENPYAVTFTMKQNILISGKNGDIRLYLDYQNASSNFGYFLHLMNGDIFHNLYKRFNFRIKVFPTLEESKNEHLHYHFVIDKPEKMTDTKFRDLIIRSWYRTRWSDNQLVIKNSADNGWISYIMKFQRQKNIPDSIDWNNVYL